MPCYTKEQLVAMNADFSQFRVCSNCNSYWSTPQGFASHGRACQRPLVVTSDLPELKEILSFEPEVLAGIAHKFVAALIEPTADREE